MKSLLSLLLFGSVIIISCSEEIKNEIKLNQTDGNEYIITIDDPIYNILLNEDGYTFDDLHQYYIEVKETRSSDKNYNNLRKKIMNHMKIENMLINHPDKIVIEYYVNEILSMDYISDMQHLAWLLTKLKGHWDIEKIRSVAETSYERNLKYIYENFPDPEKALQDQGEGVKRLKFVSKLIE